MTYRPSRKLNRPPLARENPDQIYVTDRRTGRLISIDPNKFPAELRPAIWFENVFWRHSGYLSKTMVMKYLNREPLGKDLAARIGNYILLFAQNMACAGWLFADGPQEKKEHQAFMGLCIRRLKRVLEIKPFNIQSIAQMVSIGMDYALDPF